MRTIDRRQRIFLARLRKLEEELLEDEPDLVAVHAAVSAVERAGRGTTSLSPSLDGWQVEDCIMFLRDMGELQLANRVLLASQPVFPEECFIIEAAFDARFGDRRRGIKLLRLFGTDGKRSSCNRFVAATSLCRLNAADEVREVVEPLLQAALKRNDAYRAELCTALLNGQSPDPE